MLCSLTSTALPAFQLVMPKYLGDHREGRVGYEDFLRVIDEGESPLEVKARRDGGMDRCSGRTVGEAQRSRLKQSLRRAVARGIDYRREMELQDAAAPGEVDGVVSSTRFDHGRSAPKNGFLLRFVES